MREILFRGKSRNGIWKIGYYFAKPILNKHFILSGENQWMVLPETVGQYTGLTDKNGTNIFEGDIVKMPAYRGGKCKSVIYFKQGKFAVDGSNYAFKDICPRNMEVIGNLYDNPELLGGTDNAE